MSSFKTGTKKLHPGTVIVGENGLPVDTIATISGSYQLVKDVAASLYYAAGVVTVPGSVNLEPVRNHKTRYTGRLILITADNTTYFIDKVSVNPGTFQFNIYSNEGFSSIPPTIDTEAGWVIAEAEIINRLATSSAAKIDSVEFRDMQFQFELDGDPVTVRGENGNTLEPNSDGSVNIGNVVSVDTDLTNVENKLTQLIGEAEAANLSLDNIENTLSDVGASTAAIESDVEEIKTSVKNIEDSAAAVEGSAASIDGKLTDTNASLQAIEDVLSSPLQIEQPVLAAGTQDGTSVGAPVVFVNNVKNQILAAHDRQQEIVYADFGTRNQRVTAIIYTSPTFPSVTATKAFTYTLVGNRYRRDTITWSVT